MDDGTPPIVSITPRHGLVMSGSCGMSRWPSSRSSRREPAEPNGLVRPPDTVKPSLSSAVGSPMDSPLRGTEPALPEPAQATPVSGGGDQLSSVVQRSQVRAIFSAGYEGSGLQPVVVGAPVVYLPVCRVDKLALVVIKNDKDASDGGKGAAALQAQSDRSVGIGGNEEDQARGQRDAARLGTKNQFVDYGIENEEERSKDARANEANWKAMEWSKGPVALPGGATEYRASTRSAGFFCIMLGTIKAKPTTLCHWEQVFLGGTLTVTPVLENGLGSPVVTPIAAGSVDWGEYTTAMAVVLDVHQAKAGPSENVVFDVSFRMHSRNEEDPDYSGDDVHCIDHVLHWQSYPQGFKAPQSRSARRETSRGFLSIQLFPEKTGKKCQGKAGG
jgi:hypothetical protein